MAKNRLRALKDLGQSPWLDYIRRDMIIGGELRRLVEEDGLAGVTSNPAIFQKAIAGSQNYDAAVTGLALAGHDPQAIYTSITVTDVGMAAEELRPVYDEQEGHDGFVSLEVNPHLAHDTEGTVAEALRLWTLVDRPNLMIKVPATLEGLPAIRRLIAEGVNVNVTLLFGLPRYRRVAEAYLAGLEDRLAAGGSLERVASVASFFLSRIDVLVDPKLGRLAAAGGPGAGRAAGLRGKVALASAKEAHAIYEEIFGEQRFRALAQRGARPQRLLWASTSTKNPDYSDLKYVEPLIGPQTVNTLPTETLEAYRDHGKPRARLGQGREEARRDLETLAGLGLDLDRLTQELEDQGVDKFNAPYDSLMATLAGKVRASNDQGLAAMEASLGGLEGPVRERLEALDQMGLAAALWERDPAPWASSPEGREVVRNALGWLDVAQKMVAMAPELAAFNHQVKDDGFTHVVHMGMGGSSLAPKVLAETFGAADCGTPLTVLDSTDPAHITALEKELDLAKTLFIMASKSGTTAEARAFGDYFFQKVDRRTRGKAGRNFVAITDPGTPLAALATERGFRRTFLNFADIGGRYSALSLFGMLPAALLGQDVPWLLARALAMAAACRADQPAAGNPALVLGAILGQAARQGRDKVTFLAHRPLASLGMWLEQLLAESTGKEGTGLIPVEGEKAGAPGGYGDDRLFVHLRLAGTRSKQQEEKVAALRKAGHPVVSITLRDRLDLAQEFFRWEAATAVAGAILGINAFDQPNVQESKDNTRRLLDRAAEKGLPAEEPLCKDKGLTYHGPADRLDPEAPLASWLAQTSRGDYIALLAYLDESPETIKALAGLRSDLRRRLDLATTVGFGPRYLHSTGQLHKGGPDSGVFLVLTADQPQGPAIPGRPYGFGTLIHAQSLGDHQSLLSHGRRALRVHLGRDPLEGLERLRKELRKALSTMGGSRA